MRGSGVFMCTCAIVKDCAEYLGLGGAKQKPCTATEYRNQEVGRGVGMRTQVSCISRNLERALDLLTKLNWACVC